MIFITGDTHNRVHVKKINNKSFPIQKELTRDDYLIICGDFGFLWDGGKNDEYWLDWLSKKNFTILWIDGNHENFDLLYSYPVEKWKGGKARVIRENIIHLERGQIFNINGLKFFTFGGAYSIDKNIRTEGKSWWPQEVPTKEEMVEGLEKLKKVNYEVDYVITHAAPLKFVSELIQGRLENEEEMIFCEYLDKIYEKLIFKKWFFGHYHRDRNINSKTRAIFHDIVLVNEY